MHRWEVIAAEDGEAEGLSIDAAVFGNGPNALILSSGLHGVEGFAGSAIQLAFLKQGIPDDTRVILLHALNPYGMAHTRRVNESNVDLNRNFLGPAKLYTGATKDYQRLDPLLNPARPVGGVDLMLLHTALQILRHGYAALKTAVVGGQYDFPKGLFFGGKRLERGPQLLLQHLPSLLEGAERIVHIDFHTGLGDAGTYALLVDTDAGSAEHLRLLAAYGERIQPWDADHGVAYKISGGLPGAMTRLLGDRTEVITCEFGTIAALKVLRALRAENQATHWGGDIEKAKAGLLSAFRPKDAHWEEAIIAGGLTVVNQALVQLRA